MKIGVFGGCFNPFHLGHLSLIKEISSQTEMDKIIFIPNMNPYYKESYSTHFDIVESMINLSIPGTINYEISPLESQPGKDYRTYDTLKILLKSQASNDFSLILGSDQFIQFHKWKNFKKIINLVNIIVGIRNPYSINIDNFDVYNQFYKKINMDGRMTVYESVKRKKLIIYDLINKYDISSSSIQQMLLSGNIKGAKKFLSPKVLDVILSKGLNR